MKSIINAYNSSKKEIVIKASTENYERLYGLINELIEEETNMGLELTIKFNGVSVDLNMKESLIVINTLAVKRSEIRGGLWSEAGKKAEKYLMKTLCKLYSVPEDRYNQENIPHHQREVDFYLRAGDDRYLRCEVKLMGKGNPESADAIFAREPKIFIADKLSDLNKTQANQYDIKWVELRSAGGYKKIKEIFDHFEIPNSAFDGDLNNRIDEIMVELFGTD